MAAASCFGFNKKIVLFLKDCIDWYCRPHGICSLMNIHIVALIRDAGAYFLVRGLWVRPYLVDQVYAGAT